MRQSFWYSSLFYLCILSIGIGCNETHSETKIIGGTQTRAPRYFVSLHVKDSPIPFCGGTLIRPEVVLTAAHCVSSTPDSIEVWIAMDELAEQPKSVKVEGVEIHKQYNSNSIQHDIALLHLAPPEAKEKRKPIAWPAPTESSAPASLRVYGFGSLDGNVENFPETLQSVLVDAIPGYDCQALGGPYGLVLSDQICAGDFETGARDSCYGDSGGPLVSDSKKPELFGIVSWGSGCGVKGKPGVYTRVEAYKSWITAHLSPLTRLPIDELIGAAFYYPLIYEQGDSVKRFSAQYGLWRTPLMIEGEVVKQWRETVAGQSLELSLVALSGNRYRLRLKMSSEILESAVTFTSMPRREY